MRVIVEGKFSTTDTGTSYYNDIIYDPEYMKKKDNVVGEVKWMTPQEYIDLCAKYGFNEETTPEKLRTSRMKDGDMDGNREFYANNDNVWMPYIDLAHHSQEGLHRAIAAEEAGEDKIPILVVDWFDKERAKEDAKIARDDATWKRFDRECQNLVNYTFDSIEDIKDELEWNFDRLKRYDIDCSYLDDEWYLDDNPTVVDIFINELHARVFIGQENEKYYISKIDLPDYDGVSIEKY